MKTIEGINARLWTEGVPVEEEALQQIKNTASLPIMAGPVAVMPDVHFGIGATVGTVVATNAAVIPAAVGVDIGCGMCAVKTNLTANDLPDSLAVLRSEIEARVPVGFGEHSHRQDFDYMLGDRFSKLRIQSQFKKGDLATKVVKQAGTLGGGNHFVEVCLDEHKNVWVMLHSGSRGVGNIIGQTAIKMARERMNGFDLPDRDLAWLEEGTPEFDTYIEAMQWAQDYAAHNRALMMNATLYAMNGVFGRELGVESHVINCHHNYTNREVHFGKDVWLTRKGAVSAKKGELGIIPGSMGAKSFIVRGKGNEFAYCSCSHGAGRTMSRTKAKKVFTVQDVQVQTAGVECRKDAGIIDEIPGAYKSIDDVMAAQRDLVDIEATLKQILCIKG